MNVVSDRKEPTVGTFGAFDAGLLAHASDPLVGTGGRVPRPACFAALESPRVHVVATSEERTKERDLVLRRRCSIDRTARPSHGDSHVKVRRGEAITERVQTAHPTPDGVACH